MSFCHDKGIPHSVFLDWDPEDRAKELAFMAEQGERCDMCGTAPWEWEQDPHAYTVTTKFCKGCNMKSAASDAENTVDGHSIILVPMTKQERAKLLIKEEKRFKKQQQARRDAADKVK